MLGDRLRKKRKQLGISRNGLAKMLNVTPATISNYETGKTYPKIEELIQLFEILDTDANYLYQDEMKGIQTFRLSEEEIEIIKDLREISQRDKELIKVMLNHLKKQELDY